MVLVNADSRKGRKTRRILGNDVAVKTNVKILVFDLGSNSDW